MCGVCRNICAFVGFIVLLDLRFGAQGLVTRSPDEVRFCFQCSSKLDSDWQCCLQKPWEQQRRNGIMETNEDSDT